MYVKAGFQYQKLLSTSQKVLERYRKPDLYYSEFMSAAISNCILSPSDGYKSQLMNLLYTDIRSKMD